MNVIAGILIGVLTNTWTTRLLIPLGWGLVFCLFQLVFRPQVLESHKRRAGESRWGLSPAGTFFFVEYLTATATSLLFAAAAGLVMTLL